MKIEDLQRFFDERPALNIGKVQTETKLPIKGILKGHVPLEGEIPLILYRSLRKYGYGTKKEVDAELVVRVREYMGMSDDIVNNKHKKLIYLPELESLTIFISNLLRS